MFVDPTPTLQMNVNTPSPAFLVALRNGLMDRVDEHNPRRVYAAADQS